MKKENLIDLFVKHFLDALITIALIVYYVYDIGSFEMQPAIFLFITFPFFIAYYLSAQTDHFIIPRKGMDEQDLKNIHFTKNWHEVRQKGLWYFLIIDGAIILGALLSLYLCLLTFCLWKGSFNDHLSSPSDIFKLIGNSYFTGAIIAIICQRLLWYHNERRFDRLTNPIH